MSQEGLPIDILSGCWEDPRNSNFYTMKYLFKTILPPKNTNLSSRYNGHTQCERKCPWRILLTAELGKAPLLCNEKCTGKVPPCCSILPLGSSFWNSIHFTTSNSESVHLCTHPQSFLLALTLASSLLPQHAAAIFIITHITLSWVPAIFMSICYSCLSNGKIVISLREGAMIYSSFLIPFPQTTYLNIEAKAGIYFDQKAYLNMFFPLYFVEKLVNRLYPLCK